MTSEYTVIGAIKNSQRRETIAADPDPWWVAMAGNPYRVKSRNRPG